MTEPNPLGAAIKARREARGLSIARAAKLAQISPARFRQLEKGYMVVNADVRVTAGTTPRTVRLIARGLGMDTVALLNLAGFSQEAIEEESLPDDVESTVEAAIGADTQLSPETKHHLLGLYRSLVRPPDEDQERSDFDTDLAAELVQDSDAHNDRPNRRSTDLP